MDLLEYEAKHLLAAHTVPIPYGQLVHRDSNEHLLTPIVLKSQVPTGGRGKLGGIQIVDEQHELEDTITQLFGHSIKGHYPITLLAEEKLTIAREFYLALMVDRTHALIKLIAHPIGGVEVESNSSDEFLSIALTAENYLVAGEQLAELYDTPEQTFALQDLVKNLYACLTTNDATLIEINPLALTTNGRLVAGDCKMTLDASAGYRHPEWNFEQQSTETNFVTLDPYGNVATIANGAGLAMATVDAVAGHGMQPANFLDVGGGANAESVLAAFMRIMTFPDVRVIVINIFAGITRCDEIAKAIISARQQLPELPPLCIRLAGTNYEQAEQLLAIEAIPLLPTLEDCLSKAQEYTS